MIHKESEIELNGALMGNSMVRLNMTRIFIHQTIKHHYTNAHVEENQDTIELLRKHSRANIVCNICQIQFLHFYDYKSHVLKRHADTDYSNSQIISSELRILERSGNRVLTSLCKTWVSFFCAQSFHLSTQKLIPTNRSSVILKSAPNPSSLSTQKLIPTIPI